MNILEKLESDKKAHVDSLHYELRILQGLIAGVLHGEDISTLDRCQDMVRFHRERIAAANEAITLFTNYIVPVEEKVDFLTSELEHERACGENLRKQVSKLMWISHHTTPVNAIRYEDGSHSLYYFEELEASGLSHEQVELRAAVAGRYTVYEEWTGLIEKKELRDGSWTVYDSFTVPAGGCRDDYGIKTFHPEYVSGHRFHRKGLE